MIAAPDQATAVAAPSATIEARLVPFRPQVQRHILAMIRDQAEAEELTQEAYARALERSAQLLDPQAALAWLYLGLSEECAADAQVAGQEAATLARLRPAGFRVPKGFVQVESDLAAMRGDGRLSLSTLCIAFPLHAPVRGLSAPRIQADRFASRRRLHAGEVMQSDNGFHAQLRDQRERGAAQVPE